MKAGALAANTVHEAETVSLEATEWRAEGVGPLPALWNCHPPWTAIAALYLFYTRKKTKNKKQFLSSLNHHRFQFSVYSQPNLILTDTVLLDKHLWGSQDE